MIVALSDGECENSTLAAIIQLTIEVAHSIIPIDFELA